jgi:hypothetical protein
MVAQNTVFILTQRTERNRTGRICLFHLLESVHQQYTRIAHGLALLFDWFIFRKNLQDFTFIAQLTADAWLCNSDLTGRRDPGLATALFVSVYEWIPA